MTDTNNTWPNKPGVPMNPERDGWHWLKRSSLSFPEAWFWVRYNEDCDPDFIGEWAQNVWMVRDQPKDIASRYTYLGPVLSHDEATALQARVAELEGALDAAARVLHKAGEQFSEYAKQHAAKGTAVSDLKAAANKQWAERCFNAHDAALEGKKDE